MARSLTVIGGQAVLADNPTVKYRQEGQGAGIVPTSSPALALTESPTGLLLPFFMLSGSVNAGATSVTQLANSLQLNWVGSVAFVLYVVYVQRGGRLFYPVAVGTGTTWTDGEVADGETVRYQVYGLEAGGASTLLLDLSKAQQPRTYLAPLTITAPGTYGGNYSNDDPSAAAIKVNAGVQGVNIVNARLLSRNDALYLANGSAANLQNVVGWARHPLVSGRANGKFLNGAVPASVTAQHVCMEGFSYGVYIDGQRTTNVQKILLQYWRSRNNNSKQTNATGYDLLRSVPGHAFQANSCWQVPQYDVLDGEAIQEYGVGLVEDVINNFVSSGVVGRQAQITRNAIYGMWPLDGTADPNTALGTQAGCGIITDGDSDGTAIQNGNIRISYNLILAVANCGVGVANGNTIEVDHNQILVSGYLPDGFSVSKAANSGLYVSNAYSGTPNSTLNNANVHDNTSMDWNLIGSRNKNPGNGFINNNAYDFSQVGINGNTQTNNAIDGRTADVALEVAAFLSYVKSQASAGRSAGTTAF